MEIKNYAILANLLLATLLTRTCFANPAPQSFYDDRSDNYDAYDNRLSRLRRGYYFVDDGFITSVAASAVRPNTATAVAAAAYYRPVLRYRHELTKHKKLFVPNLFG